MLNIGPSVKFNKEADPLPLTLRIGGIWNAFRRTMILFEVLKPNDNDLKHRVGLEYQVSNSLWLRGGWKINTRKFADYTGLTTGFGVRYGKMYLDYAFLPHSDLGVSHYLTMGLKYGKQIK